MLKNTNGSATVHLSRKLLVLAFALALGAAPTVNAQAKTPAPVSQDSTTHALTKPPITFDVISIRKSNAVFPSGDRYTADGYVMRGYRVAWLIAWAYGFSDYDRMPGLPRWCFFDKFDIQAKVDEADVDKWNKLDKQSKSLALQALLASRFNLKAHFETKQGHIYELVVAKGGPKFKAADPKDIISSGIMASVGRSMTLDNFAILLTGIGVSRPIVNKTGLTGLFNLSFRPMPDDDSSDPTAPITEDLILRDIREQLGLDLKPAEGPVSFLVVDHIEQPTAN
jgi:uncharacterized protein (TIGR03435 family)